MQFSAISAVDAESSGGNRFDVPGGRVLYAATTPAGAYAETVACLRPSLRMRAIAAESDEHFMLPGSVPADWRTRRRLVSFSLADPLPFVDVDATETQTFLMDELNAQLIQLEIEELDVSVMRSNNRHLTRAVSRWAYTASDDEGLVRYGGIRFASRLGAHELWALFEQPMIVAQSEQAIERDDVDLGKVAAAFGLTVH